MSYFKETADIHALTRFHKYLGFTSTDVSVPRGRLAAARTGGLRLENVPFDANYRVNNRYKERLGARQIG